MELFFCVTVPLIKHRENVMCAKRIEEIDKNFVLKTIQGRELQFIDVKDPRLVQSGFAWFDSDKQYRRLPKDLSQKINEGVHGLAWHTAGEMVRFPSTECLWGGGFRELIWVYG